MDTFACRQCGVTDSIFNQIQVCRVRYEVETFTVNADGSISADFTGDENVGEVVDPEDQVWECAECGAEAASLDELVEVVDDDESDEDEEEPPTLWLVCRCHPNNDTGPFETAEQRDTEARRVLRDEGACELRALDIASDGTETTRRYPANFGEEVA